MARRLIIFAALPIAASLAFGLSASPVFAQGGTQTAKVRIELPQGVKGHAPISAEVQPVDPEKVDKDWTFRHLFLRVTLHGRPVYLTFTSEEQSQPARLAAAPNKSAATPIVLVIAKETGLGRDAQIKPIITNNPLFFEDLNLDGGRIRLIPFYNEERKQPYIVACTKSCPSREQAVVWAAAAWTAYDPAVGAPQTRAPPPSGAPDQVQKTDKVYVYAYNPENGEQVGGPHVVVLATCETANLKTAPTSAVIDRNGKTFELPAGPGLKTFCIMISTRSDVQGGVMDYHCDQRPRQNSGTQVAIAMTSGRFPMLSGLPFCPAPPPKVFSVRVLEIKDPPQNPVDWPSSKLSQLAIYGVKPTVDRTLIKWEAPQGVEVGIEIPTNRITPPTPDLEVVRGEVVNEAIAIYIRRTAVSFADLVFRLTDEVGEVERNCEAVLSVPRAAIKASSKYPLAAETVDIPLFFSIDNQYYLSLDRKGQKTHDVSLLLVPLRDNLTLRMGPSNCRLNGQETYSFPKSDLLGGLVKIVVTSAQPLLNVVLWPDPDVGKYASDGAQRNRLWSNVILAALNQAIIKDSKPNRWKELRIFRRSNGGIDGNTLSRVEYPGNLPISQQMLDYIVNQMTTASEPTAEKVLVRIDDIFRRLSVANGGRAGALAEGSRPQVVIVAGQMAERIKYCDQPASSLAFLKEYGRTTIVLIDMIPASEATQMPAIKPAAQEVVTCKNLAGSKGWAGNIKYLALVIPNIVNGNALAAAAQTVLTEQLDEAFELDSGKGKK